MQRTKQNRPTLHRMHYKLLFSQTCYHEVGECSCVWALLLAAGINSRLKRKRNEPLWFKLHHFGLLRVFDDWYDGRSRMWCVSLESETCQSIGANYCILLTFTPFVHERVLPKNANPFRHKWNQPARAVVKRKWLLINHSEAFRTEW